MPLVLLVLVLDIDLARLARRHPDHGVLQLPQGRRRGVHRTRMAGDDDLVLRLIQAGEGVLHVRHGIVQGGIHRVLVQDMMPVPEDRLALAIEEELAPLSRRDIADAAVDIEGVFLLIRIAALAHPVVPSQVQRQHALFVVAEGFQIGQFGRFTDLAEVRGSPSTQESLSAGGKMTSWMSVSMIWSLRWFSCSSILVSVAFRNCIAPVARILACRAPYLLAAGSIMLIQPDQCVRTVEPSSDVTRSGRSGARFPYSGPLLFSGEKRLSALFRVKCRYASDAVPI